MIKKTFPLNDFFELLDSTFEDFTYKTYSVVDNKTDYQISLLVPGLNKTDIEINVEGNFISILYNNEAKTRRFVNSFNKKYTLPDNVDIDNITAKVENGVLDVTIPKKTPPITKKSIKID